MTPNLPQWVREMAETTTKEECHPASDQERTWYRVGFEFGAQAVLERVKVLEGALEIYASRSNWYTIDNRVKSGVRFDDGQDRVTGYDHAQEALQNWRSDE